MIKVPSFLVVGAPKAGTSSLYQYLQKHPDIYLPDQKELHYWSSAALAENTSGPGDQYSLSECCDDLAVLLPTLQGGRVGKAIGRCVALILVFL